jgi:hypothetical protein
MPNDTTIIRLATPEDDTGLRRLAALDSKRPLGGDILVAEADGQVHAAVSLTDGRSVADPFRPTAELVALLRMRATQIEAAGSAGQPARTARLATTAPARRTTTV